MTIIKRFITFLSKRTVGQSLVETAIILPIILLILAGTVEIGYIAVTQNRVSTAARIGARFGANGGEDAGIRSVILNSVTQTLDLNSGIWDIWTIRALTDQYGNIPNAQANFQMTHIYGNGLTTDFTATTTITAQNALRIRMQNGLRCDLDANGSPDLDWSDPDGPGGNQTADNCTPANQRVVAVLILHDVDAILGLPIVPNLMGFKTVRGFNMMRSAAFATTVEQTNGCTGVFPIAIEENIRTITQAQYTALIPTFTYPTGVLIPNWSSFTKQPATPGYLNNGIEGQIFYTYYDNGSHSGNRFEWLRWNQAITGLTTPTSPASPPSVPTCTGCSILAKSLAYPGNSNDYTNRSDTPNPPPGSWPYPFVFRGFAAYGDPLNKQMKLGSLIVRDGSTGFSGMIGTQLQDNIIDKRALRMVLWDATGDNPAGTYRVSGFVVFRLRGYGNDANGNWLLLEFLRLDSSCGQSS